MTIDQILKDKGFAIISVKAGETLAAAARTLDGKRIGAVVALDADGTIIGVLSERILCAMWCVRAPWRWN